MTEYKTLYLGSFNTPSSEDEWNNELMHLGSGWEVIEVLEKNGTARGVLLERKNNTN